MNKFDLTKDIAELLTVGEKQKMERKDKKSFRSKLLAKMDTNKIHNLTRCDSCGNCTSTDKASRRCTNCDYKKSLPTI